MTDPQPGTSNSVSEMIASQNMESDSHFDTRFDDEYASDKKIEVLTGSKYL